MKKLYVILALMLCISYPLPAQAELLSEENVKDINETWEGVKSGAKNTKDAIKETSKDGFNAAKDLFNEVKKDIGDATDKAFSDDDENSTQEENVEE